ncbi:SseB family protein [Pseudosulfitobacter sp. SM2401]|uniref:SseB family protein n=1 Tax=Pseudosulfitobacter sp. SM2401 TaxID=3350098 RepID=UPI0036F3B0A0
MSEMTPLDLAHSAMESAPNDDGARLAFYERLADAELFLLLESEAEGEDVTPQTFDAGVQEIVLVFDRAERLTAFTGEAAPYVAVSGRVIAQMLNGQSLGMGLNLEVAPSSFLLPAEGVEWLAETLGHAPDEVEAHIDEVAAPAGLPENLIAAIDTKLATATGLALSAYLVAVTYQGGTKGHMLAFVGAQPGAEDALAGAAGEALTFSGIEAGAMDVGFFDGNDPITPRLSRVGLRFDLPQPADVTLERAAPGSDPAKPPKLK